MRIWASTVIRHVSADERSGRLLLIDLDDDARVIREIAIPESRWRFRDPNPRGGTRGVRWVDTLGDHIVVATYAAVHILGSDGVLQEVIQHPILSYLHCVVPDERGFWATATAADRIARLDWSGNLNSQWSIADSPTLNEAVTVLKPDALEDYRDPRILAAHVHGVTHLNCLTIRGQTLWANLGMVLTHNAEGKARDFSGVRPPGWLPSAPVTTSHMVMSFDVSPDYELSEAAVCWQQPTSNWPNHDVLPSGEQIWFADTDSGCVTAIADGRVSSRIRIDGEFPRALVLCGNDRALVCTQNPLRIHEMDLRSARSNRSWDLAGLPHESVTCLSAVAA
ncbi:MAG: hypothetical protein AB7G47_09700 [Mycolicibacterium sp.]|uniref:hypothetical protein n=1 Tax=Mycolicibacterium sp. TaxID=2320850 RepID=UPI003D12B8A3